MPTAVGIPPGQILLFCLLEDQFFLPHDDSIGRNRLVKEATCSDDHVVADRHVIQDRHVASHPAVSSDRDLPDFDWEYGLSASSGFPIGFKAFLKPWQDAGLEW